MSERVVFGEKVHAVELPSVLVAPARIDPALTLKALSVFAPAKVSTPELIFVSVPVPESTPESVESNPLESIVPVEATVIE